MPSDGTEKASIEKLESEIEQTREAIADDIHALGERLSPRALTTGAKHFAQDQAIPFGLVAVSAALWWASRRSQARTLSRLGLFGRERSFALVATRSVGFALGSWVGATAIRTLLSSAE